MYGIMSILLEPSSVDFFTDGRKELIQVMDWFQLGNKPVYLHAITFPVVAMIAKT